MTARLLIAATIVILLGAENPKEDDAAKDKDKLRGTWKLTSGTVDGVDMTEELVKQRFEATIAEDKITLGVRGDMATSPLEIDPTSKPKKFDILVSLGIYELKGDELRVCLGGKTRPTEFTSKAGSERLLFVFKRVKEKPGNKPS